MICKHKDVVVSIHYTLTSDNGRVIDSSAGKEPLDYLHGHANIVPGLEEALEGASVGTELKVSIPPEKGYGVFDPEWVQKVPRSSFEGVDELQVGMVFVAQTEQGPRQLFITAVGPEEVEVNGNHPLAGETLNFEVKVDALRESTETERAQGHADIAEAEAEADDACTKTDCCD